MSIMRNAIADHQRAKLIRKVDREIDNPTPKNVQKLKEQMGSGGRRCQRVRHANGFQSSRASRMGFGRCARREGAR